MKYEEIFSPVVEGSKVILAKPTTSFKVGETVEVIGFRDDDPNKLIVKNILPGGYIPVSHIKQLNVPIRHLNCFEGLLTHPEFTDLPDYGKIGESLLVYAEAIQETAIITSVKENNSIKIITSNGSVNWISLDWVTLLDKPTISTRNYTLKINTENLEIYPEITSKYKDTIEKTIKNSLQSVKWTNSEIIAKIFNTNFRSAMDYKMVCTVGNQNVIVRVLYNWKVMDWYKDNKLVRPAIIHTVSVVINDNLPF